jgi:putative alpha-1,2-mannosidase
MQDNLETQYWAREVMDRLYKPDGYCGDEDNGQTLLGMFFCDGFYPVCLRRDYVLGAPLFKKVTLNLENGKQLIINAPNNSDKNKYVKELNWNNTTIARTILIILIC